MIDIEWLDKLIVEGKVTEEFRENWLTLRAQIESCKKCLISNTCTHKVFGIGSPKAPIMIVGEAPGAKEDILAEPFIGKGGIFLRKMLKEIGFIKGDVYLTNVLRCRPPESREPTKQEYGDCSLFLLRQIDLVSPKVIIAVGSVALSVLCPHTKSKLGGCRGDVLSGYSYRVVPVWHPNFVLGSGSELRRKELFKDLRKAYKLVFADGS
jgi:uracil-DNA glycosylase family 4